MKIKDIKGCTVVFGRPTHRLEKPGKAHTKPVPYRVLMPAAINDGYIDENGINERDFYAVPPDDSITRAGDVVLKLSAPFSAALIGSDDAGLFMPSSGAIIRLDESARERFDPGFLAGFLNLPMINEMLRAQANGSKVLVLNSLQVSELDIPEVPAADQHRIAALTAAYVDKRKLRRALDAVEGQMVESVFADALGKVVPR